MNRHALPLATLSLTCTGLCLVGCSANLFAPVDSDLGERLTVERTRDVGSLDLSGFVAETQPEPGKQDLGPRTSPFDGLTELSLTIEEARAATLANNLDLKVALVDPAIEGESVSEAEAAFNSAFTLRGLWAQTDTPTSSSLNDAQAEQQSLTPGVRIPLMTGGSANISA